MKMKAIRVKLGALLMNLHKKNLNNYRPISIISVVANVFERIIYDQPFAYVTEYNLISSHQSGFRRLHSTVTALLEAMDNWAFNIDSGNVNAVVFLDLKIKKAFDTVDHDQKLVIKSVLLMMFIRKPFINLRHSPRDNPWITIIFIIHKRLTKLPIVFAASKVCRRNSLDLCG